MQSHRCHPLPFATSSIREQALDARLFPPVEAPAAIRAFLARSSPDRKIVDLQKQQIVYTQGEPATTIFYIQKGRVRLSVLSESGKEATIALLDAGQFAGEECLSPFQPERNASAAAFTVCTLIKIGKGEMQRALREEKAFRDIFISSLLAHNFRIQENLIDQLFNSSEKRLARALLLLARYGENGPPEAVISNVSQETLAEMVGTTRSRISHFMNRFRELGYIDYGHRVLQVHGPMLNQVLRDGESFFESAQDDADSRRTTILKKIS